MPLGPAASQIAIKQLGTNGGGFFNVELGASVREPDAAVELPRGARDPADPGGALLHVRPHGRRHAAGLGRARRDARDLRAADVRRVSSAEQSGNPRARGSSAPITARRRLQPGGNMEGKEVRFGIANSALWAAATTAASNGSVNSMHDSYTPLGGLVPMWLMQLGEVVFGGVGSGLYGMLMFAHRRRVHRRPHGRPHAGVSRQEDRSLRDEDGVARAADPAARRAGRHGHRERRRRAAVEQRRESRRARLLGDPLRVLVGRQQQRQRVRGPLGEHAVLQHRARHRDVGVALLADDSGARDCRQPRGEDARRPSRPARCRRTRRCSSRCSSASC